MGGFRVFNRRFLRKHFHTFAVSDEALQSVEIHPDDCLVLYANHASWWDPLVAMFLSENIFPGYRMYAPIDAEAFEKYQMFGKMGFFPIKQNSRQGAADFLRISRAILSEPAASVWITPEGRFADVRDREAELMPGMAHLASKLSSDATSRRVWFIAAAVEYVFWEERLPEVLVRFQKPVSIDEGPEDGDKAQWSELLTARLRDAQTDLATDSISRNSDGYRSLLSSKSGTFFIYDWWRSFSNKIRGKEFQADHSQKIGH